VCANEPVGGIRIGTDGTTNREYVGVGNGTSTISTNGTISQTSGVSIAQRSNSGKGYGSKGCGSLQDFGVSGSLSVR